MYNNNSYNNDVQIDVSQCKITSIDKNDVIEVINLDNDCYKIDNNDCVISIHKNCEYTCTLDHKFQCNNVIIDQIKNVDVRPTYTSVFNNVVTQETAHQVPVQCSIISNDVANVMDIFDCDDLVDNTDVNVDNKKIDGTPADYKVCNNCDSFNNSASCDIDQCKTISNDIEPVAAINLVSVTNNECVNYINENDKYDNISHGNHDNKDGNNSKSS